MISKRCSLEIVFNASLISFVNVLSFLTPTAVCVSSGDVWKPFVNLTITKSLLAACADKASGNSDTYASIVPACNATRIAGKLSIAVTFSTPVIWSITE